MDFDKDKTLSIEKVYPNSIDKVWSAWADSNQLKQWWGPKDMMVEVNKQEFEPTGKWEYSMPMPNGKAFISEGEYIQIEEGRLIVTTANFRPMTEGIEMHIHFEAIGDQTRLLFSCLHPTAAYCKQQEEMGFYKGWGAVLNNLEEYLSK